MSISDEDRETRITTVRWSPREWRRAHEIYEKVKPSCPTFSQFVRIMVLEGSVQVVRPLTDPADINAAVNHVGRNVDALLQTARAGFGIYPGEIEDLAGQMKELNGQLSRMWDDYAEKRDNDGRP